MVMPQKRSPAHTYLGLVILLVVLLAIIIGVIVSVRLIQRRRKPDGIIYNHEGTSAFVPWSWLCLVNSTLLSPVKFTFIKLKTSMIHRKKRSNSFSFGTKEVVLKPSIGVSLNAQVFVEVHRHLILYKSYFKNIIISEH
jgi:hypothetical protein